MKGFIFAAGFGERLQPITESIPKPLIPVLNIPSICYSIMLLKEAGIHDIVCNLHYKYKDIIEFFDNNSFDVDISFSIEDEILGTGGGLKKCQDVLSGDDFVILNSDVIIDIDLEEIVDFHRSTSSVATIVLHKTDMAKNIGPVGVEGNRIVDFKNFLNTGIMSDYIYSGVAVLSPLIFQYLQEEFSSIVYTGYIEIIKQHTLNFYEHDSLWEDIGSIESYWNTNMNLVKNIDLFMERISKAIGNNIEVISKNTKIDGNAIIKNSVIGEGSIIGKDVTLENSVLLPNSRLSDCKVIDSVVYGDQVISV